MRILTLLMMAVMLQACSIARTKTADLMPDTTPGILYPVDGTITIYVPKKEYDEQIRLPLSRSAEFIHHPGQDLKQAAVIIAKKYFRKAQALSLEKPTQYLLKLSGDAFIDHLNVYHTTIDAELYTQDGELVDRRKIEQGAISTLITDENAFYNAYSEAMLNYFDELFRERGQRMLNYLAQQPSKPLSFEDLTSKKGLELVSTASGFFLNHSGQVLASNEQVAGCLTISILKDGKEHRARLKFNHKLSDIAVLETGLKTKNHARFINNDLSVRLGEEMLSVGYPLPEILHQPISLNGGSISALTGIRGDGRLFQITLPVQPGNSGSPMLDRNGLVTGILQSNEIALRQADYSGALAPNVHFALKAKEIKKLLKTNQIKFFTRNSYETRYKKRPDIAEYAAKFTVQVICRG
ncbi:S1 family peptidase [endosymbiont of Ridgeia piscesae]|nr:serine protease [endosymbiont of Ridgeia piscesae]